MKTTKTIFIIALLSLSSFANAASTERTTDNEPTVIDSYGLEELTDSAAEHVASSDIQRAMRSFARQDLKECAKEKGLTRKQTNSYFSAIKIALGPKDTECSLIFPSTYCRSFYGAHAIAYWIVSKSKTRGYHLLYSGRSDGIDILETTSKGLRDIRSVYGWSYIILKHNGAAYKRVSDGELPWGEKGPN